MIRFLSNSLNLKQIQPKWIRNSSLSSKLRFLQIFGKYPLVCYRGQLRMLLIVLEYFREPRNKFGAMSEQESVDISWIWLRETCNFMIFCVYSGKNLAFASVIWILIGRFPCPRSSLRMVCNPGYTETPIGTSWQHLEVDRRIRKANLVKIWLFEDPNKHPVVVGHPKIGYDKNCWNLVYFSHV